DARLERRTRTCAAVRAPRRSRPRAASRPRRGGRRPRGSRPDHTRRCRMLRPVLGRLRRPETAALMGYSATAFIYFGRPIAAHPRRTIIRHGGEPGILVLSLAWSPHVLLHGRTGATRTRAA